ncbi:hypothetical protein MCAG_03823 [Micromonospora sp. ATCC 39149]|uniref:hypothetical protein n=1 Tax=Micromonospora sp. (strain ATCC 39149 / NRRL 15099 / SCC 1413) TaxID=219305 RepID=UPI0001A504CA|nr:hypothetical protein [Micromonospora sp. ATCC 39149]EEP73496.1 hypothetical protein MCAG_03823 [Micromonospora sp. ATCC 39149]
MADIRDPDIRVRVALDSDPDDPVPVWTDITDRVHYGEGGQAVTISVGRQNESAEIQPTEMSWALRNPDGLFTPGNSDSPYAGRWEQGRRVDVTETVAGAEFPLGTGFLEIPDMPIVDPRGSQPVTVSAIDRMGRLDSAPVYEGTLVEQVRSTGDLVEHFPLSDTYPYASAITTAVTARSVVGFDVTVAADPEDLIAAGGQDGPPGDDQSYARWQGITDGAAFLARARLSATIDVPVGATDVVAVSMWVRAEADPNGYPGSYAVLSILDASGGGIILGDDTVAGSLQLTWRAGVDTAVVTGHRLERDAWRLITMRVHSSTGLVELWSGADVTGSATAPVAPGAWTMSRLTIGSIYQGAMGQLQIRVGPDAMTYDMHLEQYEHGYRGLHRQTVAERIVTLAGYAGVPAAEVDVSAACSTPMQAARLAGVTPAQALRAAATTGQDLLVTDGPGLITAVPRAQRYNQAVAMEIPFAWVGYRGLRYRPDKPATEVTVTRTRAGSVRRADRDLAQRYGVTAQSHELDTAVDADPANLAAWALAAHGQPRTRCPSIRISMLRRTTAERQALLGLHVGDRIEITDLPAGSPDDVGHLIVQGIQHTIGPGARRVIQFNTSPLLGPAVGDPPACPMVGDLVSASAIIAY